MLGGCDANQHGEKGSEKLVQKISDHIAYHYTEWEDIPVFLEQPVELFELRK
jgi:hypothetical protein